MRLHEGHICVTLIAVQGRFYWTFLHFKVIAIAVYFILEVQGHVAFCKNKILTPRHLKYHNARIEYEHSKSQPLRYCTIWKIKDYIILQKLCWTKPMLLSTKMQTKEVILKSGNYVMEALMFGFTYSSSSVMILPSKSLNHVSDFSDSI